MSQLNGSKMGSSDSSGSSTETQNLNIVRMYHITTRKEDKKARQRVKKVIKNLKRVKIKDSKVMKVNSKVDNKMINDSKVMKVDSKVNSKIMKVYSVFTER